MATTPLRRKRKRRSRFTFKTSKGASLIDGLMKTLKQHDFEHQLDATAQHFHTSREEVLTTILGRK